MESWREELYHGVISELRARIREGAGGSGTSNSSKERGGWTWKNHRYVRIENGRYIYPEDLKQNKNKNDNGETNSNMSDSLKEKLLNANYSSVLARQQSANQGASTKKKKSSGRSSSSSKSSASTTTENKPKIPTVDKGSVKSFDDLPKDSQVGDLYLITDLNRKVYWDGQMWVPEETNGIQAPTSAVTSNNSGASVSTVSTGNKNDSKSVDTVKDTIKDTVKKVETAISQTMSRPVSEVTNTPQTKNGQNFISYIKSTATTLANNAISAIKNSKVYQAGVNLINKIRGK